MNRRKANMATARLLKSKKFIVAGLHGRLMVYHKDDIDRVVDGTGFIMPITIAKFTTMKKAMKFADKIELQFYETYDDPSYDSGYDDWWMDDMWSDI